jgi:hypothetical protein
MTRYARLLFKQILNDQLDAVPVTTCIAGSFWIDKEPSAAWFRSSVTR